MYVLILPSLSYILIDHKVLTVDPERNRIVLTAKKTLLDTTFPILTAFSDAKVGLLTHAVIFRVTDKYLMVEFFNNVKAMVPAREARYGLFCGTYSHALIRFPSETGAQLTDVYAPGKVIKVRIISVHPETQRIGASVRQGASSFTDVTDISGVLMGDVVEGVVTQLHKLNVVLSLKPSDVRALMSFSSLARHRNTNVPELRTSLKPGASIVSLVVVSRNPDKGFVVVTGHSKSDLHRKITLSMDRITIGQVVGGRVIRYARCGAHVKLTTRISGSLHPTDASDDYETGNPFPAVDSVLRAAVVGIDKSSNHLFLSTRTSRLSPSDAKQPVDREINSTNDLNVGDTVRGFIKSVAEHGLFVMLGRGIDARVQIKELFDEVWFGLLPNSSSAESGSQYIKDWKSRFDVNQLVRGRILRYVSLSECRVEFTDHMLALILRTRRSK